MAKAAFNKRTHLEGKIKLTLKKKLIKPLTWSRDMSLEECRQSEARGV